MIDFRSAWEPLRKNGYESTIATVPGGKHPLSCCEGYQRYCLEPPEVDQHEAWAKQGRRAGVGFMAGPANGLLVIDTDYLDARNVKRAREIRETYLGWTPLISHGLHPKDKAFYAGMTGVGTEIRYNKTAVDIFGDGPSARGYYIGFGIHQDTCKPYTWVKHTPLDIPRDDLPEVTIDKLDAFKQAITADLDKIESPGTESKGSWKEQRDRTPPAGMGALWAAQAEEVVTNGGRHMWMLETVASMTRHGFLPSTIYGFMQYHLLRHHNRTWKTSESRYDRELVEAIESATNKFILGGGNTNGDYAR